MTLYYLEKMMEMKQREMEQLFRESSRLQSSKKMKTVISVHLLFTKKSTTKQVCCA